MSLFNKYVQTRIKANKNFLACITGPTGSGKTYTALRTAEKLDKDFSIDRVVFTPQEFINLLNSKTLKKGSVIVADEFGVSMNSREWQSQSNKFLNYILQTFRSKNYIVLFTSPDFGFIDAAARKLFHCHMMTQGINKTDKLCYIKPLLLQINQSSGDVYKKYLTSRVVGVGDRKIKQINIPLPSKQLIKQYEAKKELFVTQLNEKIETQMLEKKETKIDKGVQERWRTIEILIKQGITSIKKQAETMGLSPSGLREWKIRNARNEPST